MGRELAGKIEELRELIRHHDRKYYVENSPEITDEEYDGLYRKLVELEKARGERGRHLPQRSQSPKHILSEAINT